MPDPHVEGDADLVGVANEFTQLANRLAEGRSAAPVNAALLWAGGGYSAFCPVTLNRQAGQERQRSAETLVAEYRRAREQNLNEYFPDPDTPSRVRNPTRAASPGSATSPRRGQREWG